MKTKEEIRNRIAEVKKVIKDFPNLGLRAGKTQRLILEEKIKTLEWVLGDSK